MFKQFEQPDFFGGMTIIIRTLDADHEVSAAGKSSLDVLGLCV
jgi:hypothetical protein